MQNLRNLYNQALTAVGAAAEVTDPDKPSRATDICNLWYPVARDSVFVAHHWPSVRRAARLARLKKRDASLDWQATDPLPGYGYAFALPHDMVQPQYLANYTRFELALLGEENALHTNTEFPILYYTGTSVTPQFWAPDLYKAVVYTLASMVNTAKSGKLQNTRALEQRAFEIVTAAAVNAANSDDEYTEAMPQHWNGTGFSVPNHQARFFYPTHDFRVGGLAL